jgi:hypothetical protein
MARTVGLTPLGPDHVQFATRVRAQDSQSTTRSSKHGVHVPVPLPLVRRAAAGGAETGDHVCPVWRVLRRVRRADARPVRLLARMPCSWLPLTWTIALCVCRGQMPAPIATGGGAAAAAAAGAETAPTAEATVAGADPGPGEVVTTAGEPAAKRARTEGEAGAATAVGTMVAGSAGPSAAGSSAPPADDEPTVSLDASLASCTAHRDRILQMLADEPEVRPPSRAAAKRTRGNSSVHARTQPSLVTRSFTAAAAAAAAACAEHQPHGAARPAQHGDQPAPGHQEHGAARTLGA